MKLISTVYIVILLVSCNTKTKPTQVDAMPLTNTLSLPNDSLVFYFPLKTFSDKPNVDSFVQTWYSSTLYSFKEPILSQNCIEHKIYRFLWLRSFHRPVVFTFQQKDSQVWLTTKMLDKQPMFHDDRFSAKVSVFSKKEQQEYMNNGYSIKERPPNDLIFEKKADRKANIIYNKNIYLTGKEWNEFEQLLSQANFWNLPTNIDDGNTDGASWVIEARLKENYHLVDYHSPYNNEFAKAGLFIIKLSGLKEEVY